MFSEIKKEIIEAGVMLGIVGGNASKCMNWFR